MCPSSRVLICIRAQRRKLAGAFDDLERDFKTNISANSLYYSGIGKLAAFRDPHGTVRTQLTLFAPS